MTDEWTDPRSIKALAVASKMRRKSLIKLKTRSILALIDLKDAAISNRRRITTSSLAVASHQLNRIKEYTILIYIYLCLDYTFLDPKEFCGILGDTLLSFANAYQIVLAWTASTQVRGQKHEPCGYFLPLP
jgi:hypothetical protein